MYTSISLVGGKRMQPRSASASLRGRKPRKQAAEMKMTISLYRPTFRALNLGYLFQWRSALSHPYPLAGRQIPVASRSEGSLTISQCGAAWAGRMRHRTSRTHGPPQRLLALLAILRRRHHYSSAALRGISAAIPALSCKYAGRRIKGTRSRLNAEGRVIRGERG